MKRILYLSFYFEPDLCAGSFRNSPLVKELASQAKGKAHIDVVTTLPNRYSSFNINAPKHEERENYSIFRIAIPKHESGMKDQILSFKEFYQQAVRFAKGKQYDMIVASSSRLFTAYLGYRIAKKNKIPLYLDIRDIFYDTLEDVLSAGPVKSSILPIIKFLERKTFQYASHINLISGGFADYFSKYNKNRVTFYPNGIDDIFIEANAEIEVIPVDSAVKTIVYAGNLGEGQGLHKIIPLAAKQLENEYKFIIIGDGGAKKKLIEQINVLKVVNIELRPPVKRDQLIEIYKNADFLFAHLNDFKAFEKVLPSKLFEIATFPKPIIAGVGGFAHEFVKRNIPNSILFYPCDVDGLVNGLRDYKYEVYKRDDFMNQFKRDNINQAMAKSMLDYI